MKPVSSPNLTFLKAVSFKLKWNKLLRYTLVATLLVLQLIQLLQLKSAFKLDAFNARRSFHMFSDVSSWSHAMGSDKMHDSTHFVNKYNVILINSKTQLVYLPYSPLH